MAATSGTVNIVEFVSLEYAATPDTSTAPTTLKSVTPAQLKDGTFNVDIPETSLTAYYLENGKPYNVAESNVIPTISIGLATATATVIADLTSGLTLTAGTAGTTPDKLKMTDSTAKYLYIKATGKNSDGETIIVEAFKARPTYSWTGNMGRTQEPQPFTVKFSVLYHGASDSILSINPAF
jgi:hypothetical protein